MTVFFGLRLGKPCFADESLREGEETGKERERRSKYETNPPPRGSYRGELVISVIDHVCNSEGRR